jgi:hypothetical protein
MLYDLIRGHLGSICDAIGRVLLWIVKRVGWCTEIGRIMVILDMVLLHCCGRRGVVRERPQNKDVRK